MKKLTLIIALSIAFPAYADELEPNFFHIIFNKAKNTNSEDVTSVYYIKGYYYISKKDSENFGVVFDNNDLFALNGDLYVNLNNIGRVQENGSNLLIDTDPNKLEPSKYNLKIQNEKNKREFTNSSYLNYSASTDLKNNNNSLNTSFFKTFDDGVLYNLNTNFSNSKTSNKTNILDVYREQYFQDSLSKLRIGTSYSSGGSLINPASFVGFQFKKDITIDNNYIKNPYLCASGFSPNLSATTETTTDASGNVILAGVFPDTSFNSSLDEIALPLVADGTDTTIPLYIRFAKQGGGGIPKPGTYVFSIPLTISY